MSLAWATVAHAEERKMYVSIAAEGGALLAYERINVTNEYSPALLVDGYFTVGYRLSEKLAIGGSTALLLNPIGARIRVWVDRDQTDVTLGGGAGTFFGPTLAVFLSERVVLENSFGFVGLGAPGLWGGFGPAFNEAIAFRSGGQGDWKYGVDVRVLGVVPAVGDSRMFGFMAAISAGFSIALQ
jgi:hypothetical protein